METPTVYKLKTSTDTEITLQTCECRTVSAFGTSDPFYEVGIMLKKSCTEKDEILYTTLDCEQIDTFIGKLVCAKAEMQRKNKNMYNN